MQKFLTAVLLILTLFTIQTNAQDAADYCSAVKIKEFQGLKKSSQVLYPGDSNIDVTFYKLNLTLTFLPNNLSGIVTVKAKSLKDNLTQCFLDLADGMIVSSVKSNGQNLAFTHSSNKVTITLDKTYANGQEFSVDVYYSGEPLAGSGFISSASFSFYDANAQKPVIASLSEPYGSSDWWPSKDTPADKADSSEVWITADTFFVSVSNGKLMDVVNNQNGTRTYKWKNHHPIANYLISVAMSDYKIYQTSYEYEPGKYFPIIHYNYPETKYYNAARRAILDNTVNMMDIFSQRFGTYPYADEKYAHAEFAWGGGMEHQTCTSLGSGAMNNEMVIAHELAHQWFGDKVTCKDWQNIWLNEGFASYCECIYREDRYGKDNFNAYVNNFMNLAKNASGTIYVQNISSENEIFNSARSYKKGAMVLHMLRGVIGDENFFETMREYLTEPGLSYNVATTEDFQRIAERVSGMDLNYFFQEWIYGANYPVYTFGWSSKPVENGNYLFTFRVMQNANSASPLYFTMPIQVQAHTSTGDTTFTFFNNAAGQVFQLTMDKQVNSITIDPENWILKTVSAITSIDDISSSIPSEFSLAQNYPNPFNPSTKIKYSIPDIKVQTGVETRRGVSLRVYDMLGREVKTLVNESKAPGNYEVTFDASDLASGSYFYTLLAGDFAVTKKMMVIK